MKVVSCKVAVRKSDVNDLVVGLCRDSLNSCARFRHHVSMLMVEVRKHFKEVIHHEGNALELEVCDVICGATGAVQKSLIDAPGVVDKGLSLIVRHSKRGNLAKTELFQGTLKVKNQKEDL